MLKFSLLNSLDIHVFFNSTQFRTLSKRVYTTVPYCRRTFEWTAEFELMDCAAKAIFYCPTMNSHRPRSQNTAKEQALIPEKDSRRTWPRYHVSLEKSSKNHKPLEKWAKPNLLPDVTPQPADISGECFRRICHVVESDPPELFAVFSRHSGWQKQGRGRGDSRFDLAR